jgi:hypothetical protein
LFDQNLKLYFQDFGLAKVNWTDERGKSPYHGSGPWMGQEIVMELKLTFIRLESLFLK